MAEMENKKEADKKAEDRRGKGKDKRDLNIPFRVLPLPASQMPLIRNIPILIRRDTPNMEDRNTLIHRDAHIDRDDNTGMGTDMRKDADNPDKPDNPAANAVVLELGRPLLMKLKAR
jgi:hypothetical protein